MNKFVFKELMTGMRWTVPSRLVLEMIIVWRHLGKLCLPGRKFYKYAARCWYDWPGRKAPYYSLTQHSTLLDRCFERGLFAVGKCARLQINVLRIDNDNRLWLGALSGWMYSSVPLFYFVTFFLYLNFAGQFAIIAETKTVRRAEEVVVD